MERKNTYFPQSVSHPGETLKEKMEEMKMGPKEFAFRACKPEKTIIAILKGKSSITFDMAFQFECVTRIPVSYWMNHQRHYDEYIARTKRQKVVKAGEEWAKKFPLTEMIKKGWLPPVTTIQEKTTAMFFFFSVASHTAWESYYLKQQLKVAFRISLEKTREPYAISVWLRQGELQAMELKAKPYSEMKFKAALAKLKSISTNYSDQHLDKVQEICLKAGVKVVYTPPINKAPISGAARWLNDTPLIQLSTHNTDSFWFTFFHEAGHILLHGKKDVFLEKVTYSDRDLIKEKEADVFAAKWLN
jgi:plasmid maintenance system antidote protein VapI